MLTPGPRFGAATVPAPFVPIRLRLMVTAVAVGDTVTPPWPLPAITLSSMSTPWAPSTRTPSGWTSGTKSPGGCCSVVRVAPDPVPDDLDVGHVGAEEPHAAAQVGADQVVLDPQAVGGVDLDADVEVLVGRPGRPPASLGFCRRYPMKLPSIVTFRGAGEPSRRIPSSKLPQISLWATVVSKHAGTDHDPTEPAEGDLGVVDVRRRALDPDRHEVTTEVVPHLGGARRGRRGRGGCRSWRARSRPGNARCGRRRSARARPRCRRRRGERSGRPRRRLDGVEAARCGASVPRPPTILTVSCNVRRLTMFSSRAPTVSISSKPAVGMPPGSARRSTRGQPVAPTDRR